MIDQTEYKKLKKSSNIFQRWVDTIRGKNGWASYKPEDVPDNIKPHHLLNNDLAKIEVYEFMTDPPEKYFLYVLNTGFKDEYVGTFTGSPLGTITSLGPIHRSGWGIGADRRYIKFRGINGVLYGGWYLCGSGDYCKVKKLKNQT